MKRTVYVNTWVSPKVTCRSRGTPPATAFFDTQADPAMMASGFRPVPRRFPTAGSGRTNAQSREVADFESYRYLAWAGWTQTWIYWYDQVSHHVIRLAARAYSGRHHLWYIYRPARPYRVRGSGTSVCPVETSRSVSVMLEIYHDPLTSPSVGQV